jgi:selenide,water dikinase
MLDEATGAELRFDDIPVLTEAFELVRQQVLPGGSKRNIEAMTDRVRSEGLDQPRRTVLFDAQTSGGLLMAVPPERTTPMIRGLRAAGVANASVIGRLVEGSGEIDVLTT